MTGVQSAAKVSVTLSITVLKTCLCLTSPPKWQKHTFLNLISSRFSAEFRGQVAKKSTKEVDYQWLQRFQVHSGVAARQQETGLGRQRPPPLVRGHQRQEAG